MSNSHCLLNSRQKTHPKPHLPRMSWKQLGTVILDNSAASVFSFLIQIGIVIIGVKYDTKMPEFLEKCLLKNLG